MKTAKRLPRLARIVKSYLRLFEPGIVQTVDFMERSKLKGERLDQLRREITRLEERAEKRAGFTLVEMLVAIGLVVLLMTMFAVVFQMATGAMSTQKGISENDQRVRLVETILRNDLAADKSKSAQRTFRCLIPYRPNEGAPAPINPWTGVPANADDRKGYFSISENNVNDDTDDVLQLTIQTTTADRILYGRTTILSDGNGNQNCPNQPEFDDLLGVRNNAGASTTAEVAYFLRGGRLYRRVSLLRDSNASPYLNNPTDASRNSLILSQYGAGGTANFQSDFDYSAYFDSTNLVPQFLGVSSGDLNNLTVSAVISLTNPSYRWGFCQTGMAGSGRGLPREFDTSTPPIFFGRFTQEETSSSTFGYPGRLPEPANAATAPNGVPNLTVSNGVVSQYAGGTRMGEDVLLTNVIAFDIKVWDSAASVGPDGKPGIAGVDDDNNGTVDDDTEIAAWGSDDGDWCDVGHPGLVRASGIYGFYRAGANQQPYFGNRYDSWGPTVYISGTTPVGQFDNPPYLPLWLGPDAKPGVSPTNKLGDPGSDDFAPLTAIKITIRFYDVTSNQIRDITAIFSMKPN